MKKRYNYLYVEDDALSCEIMEMLLTQVVGVKRLVVFQENRRFMEQLKALEEKPDFVLLDIHMKPHNGYELLAMLRSDPAYDQAKVVAVTAMSMAGELKQLKRAGFDGALTKPLDMITFPDLIGRLEAGKPVWQAM